MNLPLGTPLGTPQTEPTLWAPQWDPICTVAVQWGWDLAGLWRPPGRAGRKTQGYPLDSGLPPPSAAGDFAKAVLVGSGRSHSDRTSVRLYSDRSDVCSVVFRSFGYPFGRISVWVLLLLAFPQGGFFENLHFFLPESALGAIFKGKTCISDPPILNFPRTFVYTAEHPRIHLRAGQAGI